MKTSLKQFVINGKSYTVQEAEYEDGEIAFLLIFYIIIFGVWMIYSHLKPIPMPTETQLAGQEYTDMALNKSIDKIYDAETQRWSKIGFKIRGKDTYNQEKDNYFIITFNDDKKGETQYDGNGIYTTKSTVIISAFYFENGKCNLFDAVLAYEVKMKFTPKRNGNRIDKSDWQMEDINFTTKSYDRSVVP